jgi:hypothetical protein
MEGFVKGVYSFFVGNFGFAGWRPRPESPPTETLDDAGGAQIGDFVVAEGEELA